MQSFGSGSGSSGCFRWFTGSFGSGSSNHRKFRSSGVPVLYRKFRCSGSGGKRFVHTTSLNPKYVQELLVTRNSEYSNRRPLDLYVPRVKQITFGYKSYFYEAPSIWNSLPLEIRRAENYNTFKKLVIAWSGPSCRCNYCCNTAQEP